MPSVADIVSLLERHTPLHYAEPWDNVGLLWGDPRQPVLGVLVCVDFSEAVAEEAVRRGCNLVLAYHPPLFKAASRLGPRDVIWSAVVHSLHVWSPHTAFDAVRAGTNDGFASLLSLEEVKPLRPRVDESSIGQGRVGRFRGASLVASIKHGAGVDQLLVAGRLPEGDCNVAVAAGSGASLLDDALRAGAQVFVTGEASHHDALRAVRMGMSLVATLHSNIERPAVAQLARSLDDLLPVPVAMSKRDADPFRFA